MKARPAKPSAPTRPKRLLKKAGKSWKRLRRSTRRLRDEAEFRAAQADLADLCAAAQAGEIDLYCFDGAGFRLDPCVPYAWQAVGETIEIAAETSDRLNVLAFLSLDHRLHPFVFDNITITSEVILIPYDRRRHDRVAFPAESIRAPR